MFLGFRAIKLGSLLWGYDLILHSSEEADSDVDFPRLLK
jgi:hypothetical protein